MLSDEKLNVALAALPGERITESYITSRIASVTYLPPHPDFPLLTHCVIKLDNGFTVTGESACVDPANYRVDVGATLAYKQALGKLWPLFGFLLAEARLQKSRPAPLPAKGVL